jgi:phage gpG-like protein
MSMTIQIDDAKMVRALNDMAPDIAAAVSREVMETAAEIEAGVKLRMQRGPHSGRFYGRRRHQASAPGEAPAPDTGALLGSIYHQKVSPLTAVVGSRMAYAAYLEWGTRNMAPRPAWTPEAEQHRAGFRQRIAAIVGAVIK